MNNAYVPVEPAAEYRPPTNAELDRRLRIAEAAVLGELAAPNGLVTEANYVPPTNAELNRRLRIVENIVRPQAH